MKVLCIENAGLYMIGKNYIIVSPCKNEEKNLPSLIESVLNQTYRPALWLVYNDGSTDESNSIVQALEEEYDWVTVYWGSEGERDLSFHYASIVDFGIKRALSLAKERGITIDYISLIDSDMVLSTDFFETIIRKFETNPKLGIASGSVVYDFNNLSTRESGRRDLPIGGLRVWREECFTQSGGFPISYSADAVSNVIARLQNWETRKFDDVIGLQSRKTSSAEGLWKGYFIQGKSDYYRDYHPGYILFKFIKRLFQYPFYPAFGYLKGYFYGIFVLRQKIMMPEVRSYYRNKHKELYEYYLSKVT